MRFAMWVGLVLGVGCVAQDAPLQGVLITPGDSLELFVDDRVVFATADGRGPRLANFDESWTTSLGGIWTFTREDVSFRAGRWGEVTKDGDTTTVEVIGEDEALLGTLRITPEASGESTRFVLDVSGADADSVAFPLRCDANGSFHGFGEHYDATDHRGHAFSVFLSEQGIGRSGTFRPITGDAHTTYFPMPYLLDVRGHGLLVETDHRVEVDLCATDRDVAWFEVVSGAPLVWRVFHGPTMVDVIRQLGDVVGRPKRPPAWAFRPWISIQGGTQAVLDEVDRLQAAQIPFSAVWTQDWTGYRRNIDGGSGVQYRWAVGTDLYEDLAGLVDTLHDRGLRFLGYANPFVDANLDDFFPAMRDQGLLIEAPEGGPYVFPAPNGQSSLPDFTNPATVDFVREALADMVRDYGMDGWMSDFGEVMPLDAVLHDGGDAAAYHNHFPVDWHGAVRAALDEVRPDGDYVTFARSGWTGVQGEAMIHWAGDQEANWSPEDGLPTVVPALLNLGLSGQPFVTHDIGGFSGGPSTKELYQRWVELGAFTPIMRTHEGNKRDQNWNWDGGPEGEDADTLTHFRRFARVHEALLPEIEAAADEAAATGLPILRHLALAFGDDARTHGISDAFLLGDDLLVSPVTTQGAERKEVFLPAGTWFHVWTGTSYEGGKTVTVDAPVGSPPVFSLGADRPDLRAIE